MNKSKILGLLMALMFLASTVAVYPVTAQEDTTEDDGNLFDSLVGDSEQSFFEGVVQSAFERVSQVQKSVAKHTSSNDKAASDHADAFSETFNNNSDALVSYTNERVNGSENETLLRLQFEDREGNTATRYVDATYSENGNYSSAEVITPSEFENRSYTSSDVDYYVEMDWYLSESASEELTNFNEKFVSKDKDVTRGYRVKMMTKYSDSVDTDLW